MFSFDDTLKENMNINEDLSNIKSVAKQKGLFGNKQTFKPIDLELFIASMFDGKTTGWFSKVDSSFASFPGFKDELLNVEKEYSSVFKDGESTFDSIIEFFDATKQTIDGENLIIIDDTIIKLWRILLKFSNTPIEGQEALENQGIAFDISGGPMTMIENFDSKWSDINIMDKNLEKRILGEKDEKGVRTGGIMISDSDEKVEARVKKILYIMTAMRMFITKISGENLTEGLGNSPHPRKYLDATIITVSRNGSQEDLLIRTFEKIFLKSEGPESSDLTTLFNTNFNQNAITDYYIRAAIEMIRMFEPEYKA